MTQEKSTSLTCTFKTPSAAVTPGFNISSSVLSSMHEVTGSNSNTKEQRRACQQQHKPVL